MDASFNCIKEMDKKPELYPLITVLNFIENSIRGEVMAELYIVHSIKYKYIGILGLKNYNRSRDIHDCTSSTVLVVDPDVQ